MDRKFKMAVSAGQI